MLARTLLCAFAAVAGGLARQRHTLPLLLCLERAVIICFVTLLLMPELVYASVLLRVGAVEGAVGLGCILGLVRATGSELVAVR